MSELIFTLTDAGIAEAHDRHATGVQIEIAEIALGSTGWTPSSASTALRTERQRVPVSGGRSVGDRQLHVTALFDGDAEYWVREAAAISDLGTVIGIWSSPDITLGYKSAALPFLAAFNLALDPLPADSVTVNVTGPNLSLFFAPEFATMATAIGQLGATSADQFDELRRLRGATSPWNNV